MLLHHDSSFGSQMLIVWYDGLKCEMGRVR